MEYTLTASFAFRGLRTRLRSKVCFIIADGGLN